MGDKAAFGFGAGDVQVTLQTINDEKFPVKILIVDEAGIFVESTTAQAPWQRFYPYHQIKLIHKNV